MRERIGQQGRWDRRRAGDRESRRQQRIVALRNQGRTWAEIAAAVGLSHSRP
jgi:hypothetical protein